MCYKSAVPLPVIPHIFRVTLPWERSSGVKAVNVLNVSCTTGNESDIGAAFDSHMTNAMFDLQSVDQVLKRVEIIHLDGTSATQSYSFATPKHGLQGAGSQVIPASAACLSMHTPTRGSRGRGRVYLGPVAENAQADGILDASGAAAVLAAWQAFDAALIAQTPSMRLVVASYKHAVAVFVTSYRVDAAATTQRRRQSQLF